MKSLTVSLLLLTLFFSFSFETAAQEDGPVDNSPVVPVSRSQAFAEVQGQGSRLVTDLYANDPEKITPEIFRSTLVGSSNDFYMSGDISLAQHNAKVAEVDACLAAHQLVLSSSGAARNNAITARGVKCTAAVDFSDLQANEPACQGANTILSGAKCCNGLVQGASQTLAATASGGAMNATCSDHASCASKICTKAAVTDATGMCAPVMTCFPTIPKGGECSLENPNCVSPTICRRQDLGVGGLNCKVLRASCSSADECCSGSCNAGQCAEKYLCVECLEEGGQPTPEKKCCRGYIPSIDGKCTLALPPFILPSSTSTQTKSLWRQVASNLFSFSVLAQTSELPAPVATTSNSTSQGNWVNDDALSLEQLNLIEDMVDDVLKIKNIEQRRTELLKVYEKRKQYVADNAALVKAGKNPGVTFTQEEYVKRYNIPAITPKERSNVEMCEFDTAKDNWLDSSNLLRNADLFVRSFETSYSGRGTQDMWHLLDSAGKPHAKNLYTRTKDIMTDLRDNRNIIRENLRYLDLVVSCQCMYAFGPERFSAEKQRFFFTQCTGQPVNRICRDGVMRDSLKLNGPRGNGQDGPNYESDEPEHRDGVEFPNYVEMYYRKLQKMARQGRQGVDDVDNIDSGAAGINHEEILVRWLRLRSCNQVDVFVETEKIETELETIAQDINRAKKPVPRLTSYWNSRIKQMEDGGVDKAIVNIFRNDASKDTWYRGYVHTESKVHSWTKKTFKFLLFLILALLVIGVGALLIAGPLTMAAMSSFLIAGGGIIVGGAILTAMQSNPKGGYNVLESFSKDFPNVIIEDRLVEKKSCGFLGLFYCKTFYRILHWPAFSNNPGIEQVFPWNKREERSCDATYSAAVGYPGMPGNPCSGPFKGTMCARSFYRPLPDAAITNKADFQPWKETMADKTLMDPVLPEFMEGEMKLDYRWVAEVNAGFQKGCAWVKTIGKNKALPTDKARFFPDFNKYLDAQMNFKTEYQFTQERIDQYKAAVKKYALCRDLRECGATNYDGVHANPWGHGDIFCPSDRSKPCSVESQKNAELFANYVYQLHFNWRHMSGQTGIGYPLAFLENYYMTLLYNMRLLTTLSVRRGLELDEAFERYNEDLAIRRGRYQVDGRRYGLTMGENPAARRLTPNVFRSFRSLGFPLSAEFMGLPTGGGLPRSGNATGQESATGSALATGFELTVLNAARRTADRVAKDNQANLNFQKQTKGDAGAAQRLAAAKKFFGKLNSPLSSVRGMARPGDNSSYSGIGGKMGTLNGAGADSAEGKSGSGEANSNFAAVPAKNSASVGNGAAGAGTYSGAGNGASAGDSYDSSGAYASAGANGGYDSGAGTEKDGLSEAARKAGMKEGDLSNMLEEAEKNRNGSLSGSESDSLFDKVSKAYMRNLDRVLLKTKGSAKPAKKEAQKDPEKEEIKKIFNQ